MASSTEDPSRQDATEETSATDEQEPLMPATTRLEHKESVYSFMLFQPPLSRRRTGSYLTSEVFLALALLILNVTLQVGLTLIAGNHIVERSLQFQTTLVSLDQATTPWLRVIDEVEGTSAKLTKDVANSVNSGKALLGRGEAVVVDDSECCNGAECAELGLPCCDRHSRSRPHKSWQPMRKNLTQADVQQMPGGNNLSFLAFSKPSAKKSSDEGDHAASANSICQKYGKNGTLHCTPPSYAFMDVWDELDVDGDGKWTLEEARADEANLGCRLGLPVEEVFRSTCRGVQRDNEDTSEHPPYNVHLVPLSVSERRAVPKDYFDWWRGLAVICVAHDVSRCGELVSKGMFDGAIHATRRMTKGGIQDLDSALDYCQRLLRPGGMCEKTLPGAYMMYRSRVTEKCGPATYSTGPRYSNPFDKRDVMSTIAVRYSLVDQYTTASSNQFIFFQSLILFLWFVNLVQELKAVIQLGDFVYSFENDNRVPFLTPGMRKKLRHLSRRLGRTMSAREIDNVQVDDPEADSDEEKLEEGEVHIVHKISRAHQVMVSLMLLVRFFLLFYMWHVGSMFLLTNHKYDDLLLNAVALAFIFELPEFLYAFLVSDEMKSDLEEARTVDYVTMLPTRGWKTAFFSKSLWGIVAIPIVVIVVTLYNYRVTTRPSLLALQCSCFQTGDMCDAASRFSREWWNVYWKDIARMFEQTSVFR